ncbi:hypothetical protein EAI_17094 [Harpegnathos saltator]|uniref:CYTH domain-containing protein n=1 Tax=Harpegnathos saltator TaxID=610380 RepID=E2BM29_HARSA|nr:hypothetical protein EAI_17094 [Harpegnathos saltator]
MKKHRQAYYTKDALINIDFYELLGEFIEIKVIDKDMETSKKIINDLMQALGITSDDLETKSYIDLLVEKLPPLETSEVFRKPKISKTLESIATSEMFQLPATSEKPEEFQLLKHIFKRCGVSITKKSETPITFTTSETSEMLPPLETSEVFRKPETSKTLGSIATFETLQLPTTSEKSEVFQLLKRISEKCEVSVISKKSEMPITFTVPETSETLLPLKTSKVFGKPEISKTLGSIATSETLQLPATSENSKIIQLLKRISERCEASVTCKKSETPIVINIFTSETSETSAETAETAGICETDKKRLEHL